MHKLFANYEHLYLLASYTFIIVSIFVVIVVQYIDANSIDPRDYVLRIATRRMQLWGEPE